MNQILRSERGLVANCALQLLIQLFFKVTAVVKLRYGDRTNLVSDTIYYYYYYYCSFLALYTPGRALGRTALT